MLELVGTLVVAGFRALLAEQHRFLVQEYVPMLRFQSQPEIFLALGPQLKRVLQQQLALLGEVGLRRREKRNLLFVFGTYPSVVIFGLRRKEQPLGCITITPKSSPR